MTNNTDDFLPERQDSNVTWLGIYEGMLCERRMKPVPGFKEYASTRASSYGKISYVKEYDHIQGYVTNFETKHKETNDGKKYTVARVTFRSESGRTAILEVGVKSEFVARFGVCVENMDLKRPVWFRSFMDREGRTAVFFQQNEQKILSNYTKENPNGLPAWKHDPITGEWDSRDYWNFIFAVIARFTSVMKQTGETLDQLVAENAGVDVEPAAEDFTPSQPDDDIPF
jgi:hypothetical protein